MKRIHILIFLFVLAYPARGAWKNGGTSMGISTVKFGTHDWILWKAYLLAKDDADLAWLKSNINYAFFGTEAPDLGKSKLASGFRNSIAGNYKDTSPCHCILFNLREEMFQPFAADRLEAEYQKAKDAIGRRNWKQAAFYVGAMAHYAGDLSQFMHLMGRGSRWNGGEGEDQKVHASYEKVFEARVDYKDRSLSILEPYIMPTPVTEDRPREIAIEIGRFTDTGGATTRTPGSMYRDLLQYRDRGIVMKPDRWDRPFIDQTGRNVNKAANAIAKLLVMLMAD
jgi:hypothetical protein